MIARLKGMGVNSPVFDLEPGDLPLDVISYARNYLLRDDKVFTFNGQTAIATLKDAIPGIDNFKFYGGYVSYIITPEVKYYLVAGKNALSTTEGMVLVYDGNVWTDLSSAAGYPSILVSDVTLWSGCQLGTIPIINHPKHFPEYWAPLSLTQPMQLLNFDATNTWADKGFRAKVFRSHNNFLFALNLTEGGIEQPTAYRWSHPADINGLPFTWDETDLSAIAGKASIEGFSDTLIDGLSLRDAFAMYSTRAMNVLDFVGGEFVWQRRKLSHSHGVLTTNCVVEAVGNHLVLTDGDIVLNDGNSITSLLTSKVKRFLNNNLSDTNFNNCFAQANYIDNEVWFFIVQPGATYPSIAIIINYITGQVSIRDIQGKKTSATFGQPLATTQTYDSLLDTVKYNNITRTYLESENSPFNDIVVALDLGPAEYAVQTFVTPSFVEQVTGNLSITPTVTMPIKAIVASASNGGFGYSNVYVLNAIGEVARNTASTTFTAVTSLPTGKTWVSIAAKTTSTLWAGASNESGTDIAKSTDNGVTWTLITTTPFRLHSLFYDDNAEHVFALGYSTVLNRGVIYRSTDLGDTWNLVCTLNTTAPFVSMTYGIQSGKYVAITNTKRYSYSSNGTTWTNADLTSTPGETFHGVAVEKTDSIIGTVDFLAIGNTVGQNTATDILLLHSLDGITWTKHFEVQPYALKALEYLSNYMYIVGTNVSIAIDLTTLSISLTFGTGATEDFVAINRSINAALEDFELYAFNNSTDALKLVSSLSLYNMEENDLTIAAPQNYNTTLQRVDFDLEGQDVVTTITRVYPHIRSTGSVMIQFGSHTSLTSPIRWKSQYVYDPATMRQINTRTTGELHAWRITSIGTTPFEFTGMDVEYEIAGKR